MADGDEDDTRRSNIARVVLILSHHRFYVMIDLGELKVVNCKDSCNIGRSPEDEGIKHDSKLGAQGHHRA